jgi:hypothetical protein
MSQKSAASGGLSVSRFWDGTGTLVLGAFVKKGGTDAAKITPNASSAAESIGVLLNITDDAKIPVSVGILGPHMCKAGGTCTAGSFAKIGATGLVEDATPTFGTEIIVGKFLQSAASGAMVEVNVGAL